jgi:hypothetical protein
MSSSYVSVIDSARDATATMVAANPADPASVERANEARQHLANLVNSLEDRTRANQASATDVWLFMCGVDQHGMDVPPDAGYEFTRPKTPRIRCRLCSYVLILGPFYFSFVSLLYSVKTGSFRTTLVTPAPSVIISSWFTGRNGPPSCACSSSRAGSTTTKMVCSARGQQRQPPATPRSQSRTRAFSSGCFASLLLMIKYVLIYLVKCYS